MLNRKLLWLMPLLGIPGSMQAATLTVGLDGGDYTRINDAIADARNRDTILVYPGLYAENVDFRGKSVVLKSSGGAEATTIQGSSAAIYLHTNENADTRIEGFTLKSTGAYILRVENADPTIVDSVIVGARSSYSAYFYGSDATLDNVHFEDNNGSYNLYAHNGSDLLISGCNFVNNSPAYGGGVSIVGSSKVEVNDSNFDGNDASTQGGAIWLSSGGYLISDNNRFVNNESPYGGAIYLTSGQTMSRVSNSELSNNTATNSGGAIYVNATRLHLNDNVMADNVASNNGGAIYAYSSTRLGMLNNTFARNEAGTGGILYQYTSVDTLAYQNIFYGTTGGSAIYAYNNTNSRNLQWHNIFYDNYPANYSGNARDQIGHRGNIEADPLLDGFIDDRNPDNDDFTPAEGSPAIDGGSSLFIDVDGSKADIGVGGSDDLRRAEGGDIVVAPAGLGDYDDIIQAVAAATDGDTLVVYPGVYFGNIDFNGKNLQIKGAYDPGTAALVGTGNLLYFDAGEDDTTVIENLTGWTNGNYSVYALNSSPVFRNMHFRYNRSGYYTAYHQNSDSHYQDTTFEDNYTAYTMYLTSASEVTIDDSTFRNNYSSSHGGAVTVVGGSDLTLTDSMIVDNATPNNGGGIYASGGRTIVLENNNFYNNTAKYGGATFLEGASAQHRLSQNRFGGNEATTSGGTFYFNASNFYINDNAVYDSYAPTGGAAYIYSSVSAILANNTFTGNRGATGGTIYQYNSSNIHLLHNIFSDTEDDVAIHVNHANARNLAWYNLFYNNEEGHYGGSGGFDPVGKRGNIDADPLLEGYSDDGNVYNDDFTLDEDSPARNAGSSRWVDADGSPADLGVGGSYDLQRRGDLDADLVVSPIGDADYRTITEAIAAAERDSVIAVYPGVYYGNLDFKGKNLQLVNAYGPHSAVIVGASTTFTYDGDEDDRSILDGFTTWSLGSHGLYVKGATPVVRNMHFRYHQSSYATYIQGSDMSLTNCLYEDNTVSYVTYNHSSDVEYITPTFHNNRVTHGGGITAVSAANVLVESGSFEDNTASSNGGAIYVSSAGNIRVLNSTMLRNKASYGGAFYTEGTSSILEIRNALMAFNQSTNYGGALYNNGGRLYFSDNRVVENSGTLGGAIYLHSNAYSAIVNSTIVGNSGTTGGGIYAYNSSDTLVANSIIAFQHDGVGIYTNHANARMSQVFSNVYDNYDGNYGGAINDPSGLHGNLAIDPKFVAYSDDGNLANDNLTLAPFSALRDAGIPSWNDADGSRSDMGFGGGDDDFRVDGYDFTVSAHGDADFRTMQEAVAAARNGDTIAVYPGVYSGDIDFDSKDLAITGIQGPYATLFAMASYGLRLDSGEGSGLVVPHVEGVSLTSRGAYSIYQSGSSLELENAHIRFNQSSYGGYFASSKIHMKDVVIEDNATSYTNYLTGSEGTFDNVVFQRNRASYGGGLYLVGSSEAEVNNSHFLNNTISHHGGGIFSSASTIRVNDTVFAHNEGTSSSAYGGAIYAESASTTIINGSVFFDNSTYNWGGALYSVSTNSQVLSKNSIYMANEARYGGGLAANTGASLQLYNNNLLENTATTQGGGIYIHSGTNLAAVNNIIAYQEDGEGIYVYPNNLNTDIRYNDFYYNYNGAVGGQLTEIPPTNLEVEMGMVAYSDDRDITNDDQHLTEDSLLIDAGDPARFDADESRSDIGAYGGDGAPALDLDGDGYTVGAGDCDDNDPTVYPGAPELEDGKDNDCNGVGDDPFVDLDDDGYSFEEGDCNDDDADINPGADEVCDVTDNDCDGITDEGVSTTYYADDDDDGYGDGDVSIQACTQPAGYTTASGDCNDSSDVVNPGADEVCDGLDNDCNGLTDEEGDTTFYADGDGDGYGVDDDSVVACIQPAGYAEENGDCDDDDAELNPGVTEVCDGIDNNCDGRSDEGLLETFYMDSDDDGYGDAGNQTVACEAPFGYVEAGGDCDDESGDVNPGAQEVCDEADNNCDGSVDEGLLETFYQDVDGDGYGTSSTLQACEAPAGYADVDGDCDDGANSVNPSAEEVCDEVDNNCDGDIDEDLLVTYYADGDEDGFGLDSDAVEACAAPEGYVEAGADCDDEAADINPNADELCNGIDDNCDGQSDEGFDNDGDGVATCEVGELPADCNDDDAEVYPGNTEICDGKDNDCDDEVDEEVDGDGDGYTGCTGDCDDNDPAAYPGNVEICDGSDNDCNGSTDEGFDLDGDGYAACEIDGMPADCDDSNGAINPGSEEVCDGIDNNCDGQGDEGYDLDGDGYYQCVLDGTGADCNDSDAAINPGATEVCDGVDNNCDGQSDEGVIFTYCIDSDGDGYGSDGQTQTTCEPGDDYVQNCTDTNDDDDNTYPGADEVPDGKDNDGDGTVDEDTIYYDDDNDGYSENEGDCDDDDVQTYPGQTDYSDGFDNDCDDKIDEDVSDEDLDGDGVSTSDGDCDDTDDTVNPDADEVGDEIDNDCDGAIDEGTELGDDDEDGYSPEDGDCDDNDPSSYPGAPEYEDDLDNDCDDIVDEDLDSNDDDGDGFGEVDGDCDDTRPDVNPDADEVEDGVDNDCDGIIDEGTDGYDNDGDGYSNSDGDCDDNNPYVSPGTAENPNNGVDDDCDGQIDEVPGEDTPTPGEDTPTPGEDTPTPGEDTPTPGEETPSEGTPTDGTPGEETPGEETPTYGTPLEETPTMTPSLPEETPTWVETETPAPTETPAITEPEETPAETPEPTDTPDNPGDGDSPTPGGGGDDGGCECSSGGNSTPSALAFMLLGFLGLRATRRRS